MISWQSPHFSVVGLVDVPENPRCHSFISVTFISYIIDLKHFEFGPFQAISGASVVQQMHFFCLEVTQKAFGQENTQRKSCKWSSRHAIIILNTSHGYG